MTLAVLHNLHMSSFMDSLASLVVAFVLGGIIGFERQFRQRTAGLRTNVLVAVGAAVFVDMAILIDGPEGGARAVSYVISGIGFLGAGVIMREQGRVSGLNTAATLWGAAAIGACAGAHLIAESCLAAFFVLAANTFLRPVANAVNRQPMCVEHVETAVEVHVIAENQRTGEALLMLRSLLRDGGHAVSDIDVRPFGEDNVEIEALFTAGTLATATLESLVQSLADNPAVKNAYWSPAFQD